MWNIIQCAVQGRSHISSETPCQDKTFSYSDSNTNIIALADGAGSARLSHFGAEAVTQFVCSEFSQQFDEYYVQNDAAYVARQLLSGITNTLEQVAQEHKCDTRDLSSTLLFAAVKDDSYILIHIGDGVIGYYKNGEIKTASEPNNGEFANTTVFTTSNDAISSMRMLKGNLGEISGFVLMSDGSEASLYDKRNKVPAQALKKIMEMCTYIRLDRVQARLQEDFEKVIRYKTTDDCSLAILVKKNPDFNGYLNLKVEDKQRLLGTKSPKKLEHFDTILRSLQKERSLDDLAHCTRIKVKYLKRKYLKELCARSLIEQVGAKYRVALIMEG